LVISSALTAVTFLFRASSSRISISSSTMLWYGKSILSDNPHRTSKTKK
jgi:hypothetical protein